MPDGVFCLFVRLWFQCLKEKWKSQWLDGGFQTFESWTTSVVLLYLQEPVALPSLISIFVLKVPGCQYQFSEGNHASSSRLLLLLLLPLLLTRITNLNEHKVTYRLPLHYQGTRVRFKATIISASMAMWTKYNFPSAHMKRKLQNSRPLASSCADHDHLSRVVCTVYKLIQINQFGSDGLSFYSAGFTPALPNSCLILPLLASINPSFVRAS